MKKTQHISTREEWDSFMDGIPEGEEAILFKVSPRCGISVAAEEEFDAWYESLDESAPAVAKIDVVSARSLARGLGEELGITHQSPQIIWLGQDKKPRFHTSHHNINADNLGQQLK